MSCHVVKVKHGLRVPLPILYLTVEEVTPISAFQVSYTLYAANIPDKVEGTINVLVAGQ